MVELTWSDLFSYTIANIEKYVRMRGGVYMISLQNSDRYIPIYVGQSQDLRERLLEHETTFEDNDCLADYIEHAVLVFRYCYVSAANRDNVEYTLCSKYDPECNDEIPSGTLVDITLPY